jgi:osmotically-inducible protein OsmY
MEPSKQKRRIFHTDQGRWDRRDFVDDQWARDVNDNINRHTLQGHTLNEFDEAEAMDYHEDEFHGPSGHIHSDDEFEKMVKELLNNIKSLDPSDISVTAHNGDITLSGTVKSDQQKNAASSIIQLIHGVGLIKNDIIVKINERILPTDVGRDDDQKSPE